MYTWTDLLLISAEVESFPVRKLEPNFPGVGLGAYRGVLIPFLVNFGAPREGLPAGVAITFWVFRSGDSGLGNDGRDLGRSEGLVGRPGPTDWLSFDIDGVGGVYALPSARPPRLNAAREGVVGVKESESAGVEIRLKALLDGRKIPAPGTDVVKYRILNQVRSIS